MKYITSTILFSTCVFFYFSTLHSQVFINEYSCSNLESITDNYGQYEDWIEIYNTSSSSVNIGGYYLSDNPNNLTKWQFPDGTTISSQDHLLLWCTGRDEISNNNYHVNFKLTQTKDDPDWIILSDNAGTISGFPSA